MATKRTKKAIEGAVSFVEPAAFVVDTPLGDEMEKSFLEYSYAVIYSRALPSAEDGMKPVQRRLLYTMLVKGYTPDKGHVKSARPVADCMGTYHPHGDSSIYEALVRMAQSFAMRVPLVDGFGNFGGQPGEKAASPRYTEARMAKEALLLTEELRENTVDVRPNYDGETTEPVLLPVQFPNLLVNGTSAIAVGMATNMPSHAPSEIINAARWLLTHPNATLDKLMEFVPGPDFPTGGIILGVDGIKEAYETGRGAFRIRGKYTIEAMGRGKSQIIFSELPYGVAAVKIVEAAKKAIDDKRIQGLSDMRDLTDRRSGIRLVFETKAGVNPEAVVFDLFKYTPLETSFSVNNNCLVDGEPKVVGLKELLEIFIQQRVRIVTRRTQNRLEKRNSRMHLVEGLLKALADIDKVIALIRKASDSETAKNSLMKTFKVDDIQADYILSLQLRRLTRFDQVELSNEHARLVSEVAELQRILDDETALRKIIGDELIAVGKVLDQERNSEIIGGNLAEHLEEAKTVAATSSLEVEDAPCLITLFASGAVTRTSDPVVLSARGKMDPVIGAIDTTTRGNFVVVTNKGTGYRVEALHVGETGKTAPKALGIDLKRGESLVAIGRNETKDGEAGLALGTRNGIVKIASTDYPLRADTFPVMSLSDDDVIVGGGWVSNASETEFVFVSSDTSVLRFEGSKVRPQGSKSFGMAGIKLAEGEKAITFAVVSGADRENAEVVTFTGKSLKRSKFSEFPIKGRATGGQRGHLLKKTLGETNLEFAFVGADLVVVDKAGKSVALPDYIKRDGAGTPTDEEISVGGLKS
jgi:DNA gyrase subunit A